MKNRIAVVSCLTIAIFSLAPLSDPAIAEEDKLFPSIIFFDVDQQKQTKKVSMVKPIAPRTDRKRKSDRKVGAVHVVDQPLDEFLLVAGKQFDVDIQSSHRFRAQIRNMKLAGDLESMLDELAAQFGFVWYRENEVVRVSAKDKATSKMIFLGSMQYPEFVKNLQQAGVGQRGLDLQHIPSSNSVLANGPASLIARMELVAEGYNKNANGVSVISHGKKR